MSYKWDIDELCMVCHYWCFKDVGYEFEPHV